MDEARHFEALAGDAVLEKDASPIVDEGRFEEAGDEWDVIGGVQANDFGPGGKRGINRAAGDESVRPPQGEFD